MQWSVLPVARFVVRWLLLPGIASCAPGVVAPRYVTSDTEKILPNDGVLITIIEAERPMTLYIRSDDPSQQKSQRLALKQGRNVKIIYTLAGNYYCHSVCSSRGCADFRTPPTFKIEAQAINYIGNASIQDADSGYRMFTFDYDYEVVPYLELMPQLKTAHPFVKNIATDGALRGGLHLDMHYPKKYR